MALKVVKYAGDRVTIESDLGGEAGGFAAAIEELRSAAARDMAIAEATKQGMPSAACSGPVQSFPVNKDGQVIEDPQGQGLHRYRIDIPVVSRFH